MVMPVHPRTRQRIEAMKFQPSGGMKLTGPMGYLDFLALERLRRAGDHRFRGSSGGNYFPGDSLSHGAAQYRAARNYYAGDQYACGLRTERDSGRSH